MLEHRRRHLRVVALRLAAGDEPIGHGKHPLGRAGLTRRRLDRGFLIGCETGHRGIDHRSNLVALAVGHGDSVAFELAPDLVRLVRVV
jgi:hypothetical protein